MSLPDELIALMTDEVTLEPKTGTDSRNNFTYGSPVVVNAYIVRMNKRALDRSGREVTSQVQVILSQPELEVSVDDRLTLDSGEVVALIEIRAAKDDFGDPYYLELYG